MHLYDTHAPIRVPYDFTLNYSDPYLAAIAYEDTQIARVVDYLERRGLLDESLVIVAGDHGESLGDHGEETHGMFVYDEALRVPLIVRGPGIGQRRVRAAVRLIDVMPTVLESFGLRAPSVAGVSLTGLISGAHEPPREVYAESRYPERFGWGSLRALRAGRWKIIDAPRPELYDVVADPGEQRNLFDSNPRVAAALLDRLRTEYAQANPGSASTVIDRAAADRLASLGYVAGVLRQPAADRASADPKDMIGAFNHITRREAGSPRNSIKDRCSGA
jgi:choline-sulfatase